MMQRVLITGATSGIGKGLAHHYAEQGASLLLVGRSPDKLRTLVEELDRIATEPIETFCVNLNQPESVKAIIDRYTIDIFINNAGLSYVGPSLNLKDEEELEIIRVNYITPFLLTKWVSTKMLEQGRGTVVNVCSTSSLMMVPYLSTYSSTKKAIYSYTVTLNKEIKQHNSNIHLLAVCPGPTKTGLLDNQEDRFSQRGRSLLQNQMTCNYVVKKIAKAVTKRKAHVLIGPLDRVFISLLHLLPDSLHAAIVEKVFGSILQKAKPASMEP